MAQPFVGEIRMFGGNFAPAGWLFCEGQLLSISENETLFTLIGTIYGGDGQSTFALPDLRGRLPIHMSSGFTLGQSGGVEEVTLTTNQLPAHNHQFLAFDATSNTPNASNNLLGKSTQVDMYIDVNPVNPMSPLSISPVGGSQPHDNKMPFLCINFIISLFGIFPSQ